MQQLSQTSEHLSHQLSPGQDESEFKNTVLHDTQSIKGTMHGAKAYWAEKVAKNHANT